MSEPQPPRPEGLSIRPAARSDCADILAMIRELAEYEELANEVSASQSDLLETLFGDRPSAEVLVAEWQSKTAGFALFFSNYSTFLGRPGIYLEDLFVRPEFRGHGIGSALLSHLARLVVERKGGRLDWWVLHWNKPAIRFYERIGARAMSDWLPMRLEGPALLELAKQA
jgi:GNAT superfamily N-acetyltransferase